jgi:tetratricopeptide (TPR) repeat protein
VLTKSRFRSIWSALEDQPTRRAVAAKRYAARLFAQGDQDEARTLLQRAGQHLHSASSSTGSPFRAMGDVDAATARRILLFAMAEGFEQEGEFARAYEVLRDVEDETRGLERAIITRFAFNAGRYVESCRTLRDVAYAAAGDEASWMLSSLAWRLYDVGARDAARAFVADALHAVSDRYAGHVGFLDALLRGDGSVPPPLLDGDAGMLACAAEAAMLRGDLETAERDASGAVHSAVARHGGEHPYTTDPLYTLARVLVARGRLDDARSTARRAISIIERRCGREHPQLVKLLHTRADAERDEAKSAALRRRAAELRALHGLDELDALRPP